MNRISPRTSRRQLFAGTLRWTALTAVALAGAATFAKRRRLVREGKCINGGMCDECLALADCGLPAALAVKQIRGEGDHGRTK
ncbi:MAG: hypothetical protein JSW27_08225 [Phycisphaerales bacterium]|nr:MAG: hypothetical protein JSW27_08225 [Phycisphaerales bacterium]